MQSFEDQSWRLIGVKISAYWTFQSQKMMISSENLMFNMLICFFTFWDCNMWGLPNRVNEVETLKLYVNDFNGVHEKTVIPVLLAWKLFSVSPTPEIWWNLVFHYFISELQIYNQYCIWKPNESKERLNRA